MQAITLERAFPQYTPAEAVADRAIHLLAVPAAIPPVSEKLSPG